MIPKEAKTQEQINWDTREAPSKTSHFGSYKLSLEWGYELSLDFFRRISFRTWGYELSLDSEARKKVKIR